MKVLVICVFPPVQFPEADHAFSICQRLAGQGLKLSIITNKGSIVLNRPNVTQYSVMENWTWREMPRLAKFIRRCSPDRILLYFIGHLYNEHPMITFAPAIARAVFVDVPFVTLLSYAIGASPSKFPFLSRAFHRGIRLSLKRASNYWYGNLLHDSKHVIVLSGHNQKALSEHLPEIDQKLILIPPAPIILIAPDEEAVRQAGREMLGATSDHFLLVYFGYLYPVKGVETLLRAFQMASAREATLQLALVGDTFDSDESRNYAQMLRNLTEELGIGDKVKFTGKFAGDSLEASTYLRAADACVLPFDHGVHLNNSSFATAVTHGLPVLTTCGPELEDTFSDGQNVLLCPPQNPDIMANAIIALVQDTDLRKRLRKGSLQLAEEKFSWTTATKKMMAALE